MGTSLPFTFHHSTDKCQCLVQSFQFSHVHGFVKRYGMLVVLLPNFNVKRENLFL